MGQRKGISAATVERRQAYGFRNFDNYRLRVGVVWALEFA
jgi:hypothetical protein